MSSALVFIPFALLAGVGTGLRALLSMQDSASRQRVGTAIANLVGAFFLGLLSGRFSGDAVVVLGVGLLGSLTTFSSLVGQTVDAWSEGRKGIAVAYLTASIVGGLVAAWVGLQAANSI